MLRSWTQFDWTPSPACSDSATASIAGAQGAAGGPQVGRDRLSDAGTEWPRGAAHSAVAATLPEVQDPWAVPRQAAGAVAAK